MMINKVLLELKGLSDKHVASFPNDARLVRTMYEAVENTLLPYDADNESRLAVFIRLNSRIVSLLLITFSLCGKDRKPYISSTKPLCILLNC